LIAAKNQSDTRNPSVHCGEIHADSSALVIHADSGALVIHADSSALVIHCSYPASSPCRRACWHSTRSLKLITSLRMRSSSCSTSPTPWRYMC